MTIDRNLLFVYGVPAGYAELNRREPTDVELSYFGLIPSLSGGPWPVPEAVIDIAWSHYPIASGYTLVHWITVRSRITNAEDFRHTIKKHEGDGSATVGYAGKRRSAARDLIHRTSRTLSAITENAVNPDSIPNKFTSRAPWSAGLEQSQPLLTGA